MKNVSDVFCFGFAPPIVQGGTMVVLMIVRGSNRCIYHPLELEQHSNEFSYIHYSDDVQIALVEWLKDRLEQNFLNGSIKLFARSLKQFLVWHQTHFRRKQTMKVLEDNPELIDSVAGWLNF